jgi:hypothetical protein
VVQASGAFVYTPATDYVGTDTFTFTVRDPSNAVSSPATVTVTIGARAICLCNRWIECVLPCVLLCRRTPIRAQKHSSLPPLSYSPPPPRHYNPFTDPPPPAAEAKAVIAGVNVDAQMDAYAAAEFAAALGPPRCAL